jgi:hypothetical protein
MLTMRPIASYFALVFVAVALPSCVSPKFQRAWKGAAPSGGLTASGAFEVGSEAKVHGRQASRPLSLPIRWEGRWHSDKHNAGGRLRAVVQPLTGGRADIFFEAGWHGFTTADPVSLAARREGNAFELSGEHNLRSWVGGGVYTYTGSLTAGQFSARYHSKYDTGTFLLTPVPSP